MHRHPHPHPHDTSLGRDEPLAVSIALLGGFSVTVGGVATAHRGWARRSGAALVKLLALAPDHRLHREKVMDILWPDESPDRAAPWLHKAAHFARRAAGRGDAVVLRDDVVSLFPGASLTVDVAEFERLALVAVRDDDPATAREALSWYGGELLPGDRYEDWAMDRRELLHLRRLDVLRVAGGWRELAELDPANEQAHIELMRRQLEAGAPGAALRQYEHLERVLDRELGIAPGEEARHVHAEARSRQARRTTERGDDGADIDELLAELAELVSREQRVLQQLAAAGAARQCEQPCEPSASGGPCHDP